ncbi:MAG: DUF1294 domain-containing protein [Rhizobiaceae bacterium]|nr:DUF1294 domain-containing protein [Rhizobiaceae bacterium]
MDAVYVVLALVGINAVSFLAFWRDKRLARLGAWRISEATLLWLAFLGGSAGAVAGQRLLRHKTRKEPFRSTLRTIIIIQIVAIAGWMSSPLWVEGLRAAALGR